MNWHFLAYVVLGMVALSGIRIAPDDGRIVVVRLGQPCHVLGPGIRFILPFIDRVHRVNLDSTIPEWRSISEPEIAQRLLHLAQSGVLDVAAS
jgi:regulator of protease activity HflC (stomatin/prohibitin superfamily)